VGGVLGILIPPSVILVVYAISTEQNIARLFMAALIRADGDRLLHRDHLANGPAPAGALPRRAARAGARAAGGAAYVIPVLLIALVVVGGIYGGIFTPTESAAVGCIATLLVGLARRTLKAGRSSRALRRPPRRRP